jgi:tripartite-type tricarboxylate transporter receptor subunit TctC
MPQSLFRRHLLALAGGCAMASVAGAQPSQPAWPQARPITIIVPFAAGAAVDNAARQVSTRLGERLGQSVVIENLAGAAGVLGATRAARSPADGYTLMVAPDTTLTLTPLVTPDTTRFDGLKDFTPIGVINTTPYVLVTSNALPVAGVSDLVRLAKARPRELNYGSPGIGNLTHVALEQLSMQAGIQMLHVPYRATPQLVTDLIANQVNLTLSVPSTVLPHIKAGRLKALGVTGSQRIAPLPEVPPVSDAPELKGFNVTTSIALFAPARTPAAIVERLNRELREILAAPDLRATMQEQGATPGSLSPAEYATVLRNDLAQYERVVKAAQIKAE